MEQSLTSIPIPPPSIPIRLESTFIIHHTPSILLQLGQLQSQSFKDGSTSLPLPHDRVSLLEMFIRSRLHPGACLVASRVTASKMVPWVPEFLPCLVWAASFPTSFPVCRPPCVFWFPPVAQMENTHGVMCCSLCLSTLTPLFVFYLKCPI